MKRRYIQPGASEEKERLPQRLDLVDHGAADADGAVGGMNFGLASLVANVDTG